MKSDKNVPRRFAPALAAAAIAATLAATGAAFAQAHDEAFFKRDIAYFHERSAISVHARLLGAQAVADHHGSDGRLGYRTFRVRARALETFKGDPPGEFDFEVTQEQPSQPPDGGDYILNLSRTPEGRLYPTDDSVGWIRASPGLLAHARGLKR
ncbi:hypothetical protein GLE_3510 [Lysobacter enzymogenes]|uniref:Uncharacterized protein n=1 Tax=Lysobacter enzymogenes TaxID=69 RepID=A0A0S2DJP0_LYSEN|nr:hypothetical protein [Lysobacter enzymogenes]ALN58855.1 hypothetical protein GLE_3510 [Lysobacter enzymogenes]QCW27127.1 hypothetical protein FE772_17280 [Lysobacter enzymogenes]